MRYRIYKYELGKPKIKDRDLVLIDTEAIFGANFIAYKILAATSKQKDSGYFKVGEYFDIVKNDILVDESDDLQELLTKHFMEFL